MADKIPPHIQEAMSKLQSSMSLQFMDPTTLQPNDMNPKKHGGAQRSALHEFMGELEQRREQGVNVTAWIDTLKWNKRTGRLLDGHLRQTEAIERGDPVVPVLVFDIDEETENLILAYMDLIGSMFERDTSMEQKLLDLISLENEELLNLITGAVDEEESADQPVTNGKRSAMPEGGLALPLGAKFDYVVLVFRTEMDFTAAQDHFGIKRQQCPFTGGIGIGRVVDGAKYLHEIRAKLDGEEALDPDLFDDGDTDVDAILASA